ncbi:VOC family protein [Cocleimonas sp. KMM 6892]|uniref:VOC family protein n=1 Tax=unclassified Cocleimonas TaxID=2639732 RepID=UPI002DB8F199|nr:MULTISPECIES: VOC family protein [unclassified Cocleimonas]MEB8430854.1 VOC family protein [Cocleimonas sp. KMM 6892]MEC4714374.1 VOC family protein [Cocleimonas sp. KMM 6895]MEC4743705.1 VOC family protein [Cocleimonas sp. KMM 6896]
MPMNPISWFEIYVDDIARATQFYQTVFAVKLENLEDPTNSEDDMQMMAFPADMESYGASGALVKMDGFPAGGNSTIVYFACDDCNVEESRVVGAGGKIQQPKMSIGEFGFISLIVDTEGNIIGLHSMS